MVLRRFFATNWPRRGYDIAIHGSPSNLRALRDRLTQAAKRENVVFGRHQQHVAVLARPPWHPPSVGAAAARVQAFVGRIDTSGCDAPGRWESAETALREATPAIHGAGPRVGLIHS
ncbi:MAG: hypothetical protein L0K86_06355 [Actinomycetia bacterium]|nr:hypothetical protein [Actinomycetes bacterium]